MDTSITLRMTMIALVFVAVCAAVYGNFRIVCFLALHRKVSRLAKVVWPVLGLLLVFCIVDATYIEPLWIQTTRHTITTSKLPPGSRLRIVHLTDLHIEDIGQREIQMLNLTASLDPDVIVLTGDYSVVKGPATESGLEQIAQRLSRIAPTYAIDGNWDIPQDLAALRRGGVRMVDDWITIDAAKGGAIALGQVSWLSGAKVHATPGVRSLYKVLLCHMPNCFDDAARSHIDLALVGHTHGGQIRLPVFGALMPDRRLVGRYQAGMYEQSGCRMYVNRGIGLEGGAAPKLRFWCRPEIAVIEIVGKEAQ